MKTITVLGSNSGRNAGDIAILGNLLDDVSEKFPQVKFLIPTTNAKFINTHFGHHNVKPVPMMPWNLCVKNLGLPLYKAMTNTDLILICDNLLFDRKFYNPLINYLHSIALFTPAAKKRGVPIVLFNCSIGPIDHEKGKKALEKVINATELVITRDLATKELLEGLGIQSKELHVHADSAINTPLIEPEKLQAIIDKEKLFTNPNGSIGFNVNAYIDNWSDTGTFGRKEFCESIAGAMDKTIETLDVDIVFFITQIMDIEITKECIALCKNADRVKVISNDTYTYEEIASLISKLKLHVGLRTHTLIFSADMNIPMIGITSYPKSAGFLRTVKQEKWQVPFSKLSAQYLSDMILELWEVQDEVKAELAPIVVLEKAKALKSVEYLRPYLTDAA